MHSSCLLLQKTIVSVHFSEEGHIAFHELIHQFQNSSGPIEQNENEAYEVANFIENHARAFQETVLTWDDPNAPKCDSQHNARFAGWMTGAHFCPNYAGKKYCEELSLNWNIGFWTHKSATDESGVQHTDWPYIENLGAWKKIFADTYIVPLAQQEPNVMFLINKELQTFYQLAGVDGFKDSDPIDVVFNCTDKGPGYKNLLNKNR